MLEKASNSKSFNPSKRSIKGLNTLLFCISDVRHGVGPLLSIHLRSALNWDPGKIGLALSVVEFSAFFSQIPGGLAADAAKRKRTIVALACCLIILGCALIVSFSTLPAILIAQIMMGISIAFISPTLGSITLGLFGKKKFPPRAGKNEFWNHTGNVFAALMAGLTGYFWGSRWIFFLVIIFAIGCLFSLLFIRPREIHYAAARELSLDTIDAKPVAISALFRRSAILFFNLSLILYYIANGAQMSLVGQILANKDPAKSALYISSAMIIAEMTMIGVAFTMSRIVNRFNRKTLFLAAFLILPIRALLYTLVESPYAYLLIQILDGIAAGILGVMGTVINSDLAVGTGRFNFLQGIGAMSTNIGESISQLFAGFVARAFGFHISFFSLALVAVIGASFFAFLMPETKSKTY